ncbi:MAG: HDIG domain-containing protein [Planctomycetes bacterium]|nr:HDIG domain-containing protein [Planctomycetota bacterium]
MSPWSRLLPRTGRAPLRRVSVEKARSVSQRPRRQPLPQEAEKVTVAALTVVASSLLIGTGAGLDARGWLGLVSLVTLGLTLFLRYLYDFRREVLGSLSRVVTLAVCVLLSLSALRAFDAFVGLEHAGFLPLSLVSLVMVLVWSRSVAIEGTVFASGLFGLYVFLHQGGRSGVEGLAVAVAGALVAAMAAEHVRRRSTLVRVGVVVGLAQAVVAGTFLFLHAGVTPTSTDAWRLFLLALQGLTVGLLVSGLLPAIETAFSVTTDISLLELGNTHEQPLLRKLLLEAPGTFHHSYIVGLLSEAAAEAVGGNALLARVGALYHDVGKLNKPGYFAENDPEARERHRALTPEMSMLIISAHPRDGVELGRYYNLPEAILDFMPEHHGTALIEYFYQAALKVRGAGNVSEESFRYPGPRPRRVETAIVMIADAAEAISRQMPEPNQARLREMVHEVAHKRLMDGQFDECPITLADLALIEDAFVRVLQAIYHQRPTYPKGKPNPLDLSQPSEERRAVQAEAQAEAQASGERKPAVGSRR